jgi:hypothetical protein
VTFKFNHELLGGHVHIAVFSGKDRDHLGKCGDLVMREEEWPEFKETLIKGAGALLRVKDNVFIYDEKDDHALIYPRGERV